MTIGGEARATRPLAVFALQGQQPRTPPLGGHPRPFRRHSVGRRVGEIPQRLPPDGGIGVQHPIEYGHGLLPGRAVAASAAGTPAP